MFIKQNVSGDFMKKNIIIIGARGYEAKYGGWETFVTNLLKNYNDKDVNFHVVELTNNKKEDYTVIKKGGVNCLETYAPNNGSAMMFIYALRGLRQVNKYIKDNNLENVFVYVLGCRMGPFYPSLIRPLKKRGVKVYLNPDGLEWTREKWNFIIKTYFKISERVMIKHSDKVICDSKAIKKYVDEKYKKYNKDTYFIAYGAYLDKEIVKTDSVKSLFKEYKIKENNYYLIVGRFVPENNYEIIIKEFMKSKVKRDLVIISNIENNPYYEVLKEKTHFDQDKRIKFVGSFYDAVGLVYIRNNAFSYLHGHSAGGTNPSLLEALATTNLNILFDVAYNKEVGEKATLYFSKKAGSLSKVLNKVDTFTKKDLNKYGKLAKERILKEYTWEYVVERYKEIFK